MLSSIRDGKILLTELGAVVESRWLKVGERDDVELGGYVVMPNHLHALMRLLCEARGTERRFGNRVSGGVPSIISNYKSNVTMEIRQSHPRFKVWQRSFHDTVVQSEQQRIAIEGYIKENPMKWHTPSVHTSSHG